MSKAGRSRRADPGRPQAEQPSPAAAETQPGPGATPRGVILVPRRRDRGYRDRVWAWVRAWWERELPELTVYEGHHEKGLFNRSAAVNAAAQAATAAGPWDVALIIDADVICNPERVREAIAQAATEGNRLVLPFSRRHNLNPIGTRRIMEGDRGSWTRFIARTYTEMCSSCVAIPRPLWDAVGGFDERFSGWGFEDNAFAAACETMGGAGLTTIEGELWHLFHPTAPEGKPGTPSFRANRARADAYQAALGDKAAIAALQLGEEPATITARDNENIPRILHRVVPETSPAEAEAWWAGFGELHPDWTLMTHRDPLRPAQWPITSPHWSKVRTGAQLAGLVRLEALWRWGGIYVDQDVQPVRSLEPLLALHGFAAWEDARCIPDAIMGFEPEHPAVRRCLDLAIKRLPQGTWESGAGVTTEVLKGRTDVLLLPPGVFYPVHYRDPERDAKMAAFDPTAEPWTLAVHRYWGSWLEKDGKK